MLNELAARAQARQKRMLAHITYNGPQFVVPTGNFVTIADLIEQLDKAHVDFDDYCRMHIIPKIRFCKAKDPAESYSITTSDLERKQGTTSLEVIFSEAGWLGFTEVVQQYAPVAALQCARQLNAGRPCDIKDGECFVAASPPILDWHDDPQILAFGRNKSIVWLSWTDGSPNGRWSSNNRFLFGAPLG